jgi:gluconolactonase
MSLLTKMFALLILGAFLVDAMAANDFTYNGKPLASVDLGSDEGVKMFQGQWRYSDATIVDTEFFAPGAEGQPTGKMIKAKDISPRAGIRNFDDTSWETFSAVNIMKRRTAGRLAFNWYRINLTTPERVAGVETLGKTIVFDTSVDDYAEIWVDGELARSAGQMGGSVISGWNAANRVVIGRDVVPGQKIQLAIFGINGPLSSPPTNFIWLHYAKLNFYEGPRGPMAVPLQEVNVEVIRNDPAINELISNNPKIWKLADGFKFTEGPLWIPTGKAHGYLLFSDPNSNTIYKWSPDDDGKLSVFRQPSGYASADIAEYGQPGSNGLALDK